MRRQSKKTTLHAAKSHAPDAASAGRQLDHAEAYFLLPPLLYEGQFLKGALASNCVDALVSQFPGLRGVFNILSYTDDARLRSSVHADGLLVGRCADAQKQASDAASVLREGQVIVPFGAADLFDHYRFVPSQAERDIDILCVSPLAPNQNLGMFAEAVKAIQTQRSGKRLRVVLHTGAQIDINWSQLSMSQAQVMRELTQVFDGLPQDFLRIEPAPGDVKALYGRAKVCVSAAFDGIDFRALNEAMACDTAVVSFSQGLAKAGLQIPHPSAKSLARTLSVAMTKYAKFAPREAIMAVSGRKHVLHACMDALPYYERELSGFVRGHHLYNRWIDLAMQSTYHSEMHAHLFKGGVPGFHARTAKGALAAVRTMCEFLQPTQRKLQTG